MTSQDLRDRGFKYTAAGISGADMWQGMGIWHNEELQLTLRGNISTARGGTLRLSGYFNCQMDTLEELDKLISLFK